MFRLNRTEGIVMMPTRRSGECWRKALDMGKVQSTITGAKPLSARFLVILLIAGTTILKTYAATYFVDASRPDNTGDGIAWTTAKRTIQAAIQNTIDGDIILVNSGVYNIGMTVTPGHECNNRVVITNAITVRSANGPAYTIIEGSGTNMYATPFATRCVYMNRGKLEGFTLQSGSTSGSSTYDRHGGGVSMFNSHPDTIVSNCIIRYCKADFGGGSYQGTLVNCTLVGNTGSSGGGSSYGTLNNCNLSKNTATSGGGSYYGNLNNCILSSNTASLYGGGSYDGTLNLKRAVDSSCS